MSWSFGRTARRSIWPDWLDLFLEVVGGGGGSDDVDKAKA